MSGNNKSLSKGGAYYLIYNVLNMAFPFVTGIYVARILLPEKIGLVAAAQNVATYFVILAFLGIPTYGLREIAKLRDDEIERNKVFSELYIINLASTIIFSLIYLCIIFAIPKYRMYLPLYLVVGLSIALNAFNISWLYEGLEEFKFISVRNVLFKAICFVLLLIFVKSPDDYIIYACITVFGTAGNYIVNMAYSPKFARFTLKGLNLTRHLKPVFYLVAVNLAIELYSLLDITMMNFLCTDEHIAYYKYGNSIYKMLLQVANTFTMVLVPRISLYYKEKKENEFNLLVIKGLKLILITSIPMIIGIYFTSDFLIQKMYGVQYANSAVILKVLSILLLISPIGYLLGSRMLLVTGNENKMIIAVGVGAFFNMIGNAIMIPFFQEFGAAGASVLSELVVVFVYVWLGKKYYKLFGIMNSLWRILLSGFIMGVYLFLCRLLPINEWASVAIQILGAIIVYFGMLMILKEEVTKQYLELIVGKIKSLFARA